MLILYDKGLKIIDIHTHILPGMDDGAEDIDDSVQMAYMAEKHGSKAIVATPHCNIPGAYSNYLDKYYREIFLSTKKAFEKEGLTVKLLPGMEVFATYDLPRLIMEKKIMPLNKTSYILLEFDFKENPDFAEDVLQRIREINYNPVIAHVERYEFIQDNPHMVQNWRKKGYVIQANKGSFKGRFGKKAKRTVYGLSSQGIIDVIASDAHNPHKRTSNMEEIYDLLLKRYSAEYINKLFFDNPQRLCQGKPLQQMIDQKKIFP